jgi:hypothetical protein
MDSCSQSTIRHAKRRCVPPAIPTWANDEPGPVAVFVLTVCDLDPKNFSEPDRATYYVPSVKISDQTLEVGNKLSDSLSDCRLGEGWNAKKNAKNHKDKADEVPTRSTGVQHTGLKAIWQPFLQNSHKTFRNCRKDATFIATYATLLNPSSRVTVAC